MALAKSMNQSVSYDEIASHKTEASAWIVLSVVDVTSFLEQHPGGKASILQFAGTDATEMWRSIHPKDHYSEYLNEYGASLKVVGKADQATAPKAAPVPAGGQDCFAGCKNGCAVM